MIPPSLAKTSPMMEQWHQCKSSAKGALLLFRLGDFYEAFFEDAKIVAKELEITLTERQGVPMSGVPAQTLESYLEKLVAKGFLVAVAEQMEDAKQAKGIVKRAITRIVSPATHIESTLFSEKTNNFFASIQELNATFGLCFLDLSTGEMFVSELESIKSVIDELSHRMPTELLVSVKFYRNHQEILDRLKHSLRFRLNLKEEWFFDHKNAYNTLTHHFKIHNLDGFGLKGMISSINAAGALFHYLTEDLCQNLNHVQKIQKEQLLDYLAIDETTKKHLDITSCNFSLLEILDRTLTPMGGRLLRYWTTHPLVSPEKIKERQDAIDELIHVPHYLKTALSDIRDLERLTMRVKTDHANPRDLLALGLSLEKLPLIFKEAAKFSSPLLHKILSFDHNLFQVGKMIKEALIDPAPIRIHEGGIFKKGYSRELDELKLLKEEGHSWLMHYQNELRQTYDIKTLKVSYTKAFGYYIEISRGQIGKLPPSFERRQTLVNAERYISPALKEFEHKILHAEEKMLALESELFLLLRKKIHTYADEILKISHEIARIDVLFSLASIAKEYEYVRPIIDQSNMIAIEGGRHPIIETVLQKKSFIANNTLLNRETHNLILLTGPNMAGKSTYIRQVALIVILAQMGSFVPAKKAHIGIVDRIFSRIGASDDLVKGQSTFMVEMTETANILHSATEKSLVILDEIGRGTSTYDGIAIASAVAEHLLTKIKAKTLFATHFAELTRLEKEFPGVKNYRVAVQENEDGIVFLHKILEGGADKSYGIHVAKLAGLPNAVIQRAKALLSDLEEKKSQKKKSYLAKNEQLLLFSDPGPDIDLIEKLQRVDTNRLTPLEALELIVKWKDEIRS